MTVSSVGALSPTVVKLQNNRRPQGATLQKFSAISNCCRPQGATLQKFSAISNCCRPQGATLPSIHGTSDADRGTGNMKRRDKGTRRWGDKGTRRWGEAGRQMGRSAGREIGRSADGQFGGLTVSSVRALSPTVVKLQNSRRPQGATLQKFWQFQTSAHWRARLLPSRNFGSSAIRQFGKSAGQDVGRKNFGSPEVRPPERKNSSAHKDVCPPKSRIFIATKVALTANFVFHANFFGCSGEQLSKSQISPTLLST